MQIMVNKKTRNWFEVRGVEYSTNLRFFMEHQVAVVKTGQLISIISRMESYRFFLLSERELSIRGRREMIRQIHVDLLSGKHGEGKFIN